MNKNNLKFIRKTLKKVLKENDLDITESLSKDCKKSLKKIDEAINYTRCSVQLLCVDKQDNNALTVHYTYEAIRQDNTHYKIVDNYGNENWFLKEQFEELH